MSTPKRQYSLEELIDLLKGKQGDLTITEYAAKIGISAPMLSNVLCGHRRADGSKVLKFLGMKKVEMYERV